LFYIQDLLEIDKIDSFKISKSNIKYMNYRALLNDITTFVFDYDGVLSDGSVIVLPDGEALRRTNVKDGYALQLAVKHGYNVVIISGGKGAGMEARLKMIGASNMFLGVKNKVEVFDSYLQKNNLKTENVLYMGDDIPDYEVMQKVGVACCPADAVEEIRAVSHYISHKNGGSGCVRDVIEQVMKVQGKWMNGNAFHW